MRKITEIVEDIEQKIVRNDWPVGTRIPSEARLTEQYGSSRTVIREALEQLRGRHLISTVKGSGSYVSAFTSENLADSFSFYTSLAQDRQSLIELLDLRCLMEADAVSKLIESSDAEAIEAMAASIERLRVSDTIKERASADMEFHLILVKTTGNRLYELLLTALQGGFLSYHQVSLETHTAQLERLTREHTAILDAIKAKDKKAAREAINTHLGNSRQIIAEGCSPRAK